MKKLSIIVFIVCFVNASCSSEEEIQKEDTQKLEAMYNEIVSLSLSNSQPCTNSQEWDFAPIGSKACGGHAGYIVYSKKIDIDAFLAKIKEYTETQSNYNKKWGIISDCSITIRPAGVECLDGKPRLSYQNPSAAKTTF